MRLDPTRSLEAFEIKLILGSSLSTLFKFRPTSLDPIEDTAKLEPGTSQIENVHMAHTRSGWLQWGSIDR
jgi:hypothetical protein